jgi:hypothetical protein
MKRVIFYSRLQSNIYVVMIKSWIYIAGFIVMIQKKMKGTTEID